HSLNSQYMFDSGKYMVIYSQNLGLMSIEVLLHRLFDSTGILVFQYLVAFLLTIGILSGYYITGYLSGNNRKAQFYYLLFMFTCFPMYGYVPYIYGDLSSTIFLLCTVWCLFSYISQPKVYKLLLFAMLAGVTVQLRQNTLVAMIAIFLVLVIRLSHGNKKQTVLLGLALLAGIILCNWGIKSQYDIPKDAESIPPLTYVYMGLNDSDENAPGWYDQSGLNLFIESDFDTEVTNQRTLQLLDERLEEYMHSPSYMFDFIRRKIITQWEVPMYHCIPMTYAHTEERGKLATSIYERTGLGGIIEKYMKIYQLLLYGGILFLLLKRIRNYPKIEWYVLLIAAFGGFLFSVIWEAKTRYVFPYLLMLVPYMAVAMSEFNLKVNTRFIEKKEVVE
nr:hypothetical protein [Acetatifactor sp.]